MEKEDALVEVFIRTYSPRRKRKGPPTWPLGQKQIDRMWSRVKIGNPDECWPWTGHVHRDGYGKFDALGRTYGAHRLVKAVSDGMKQWPPNDQLARHTCDNRICCNPAHLVWGTVEDNVRDAIERGRFFRNNPVISGRLRSDGENNRMAKLTWEQVRYIRNCKHPHTILAKRLGITRGHVADIRRLRRWWPEPPMATGETDGAGREHSCGAENGAD